MSLQQLRPDKDIDVAGSNFWAVDLVVESVERWFTARFPDADPPLVRPHKYRCLGYFHGNGLFTIGVGDRDEREAECDPKKYQLWVSATGFKAKELDPLASHPAIRTMMGGSKLCDKTPSSDSEEEDDFEEAKEKPAILLFGLNQLVLDKVHEQMCLWIHRKYGHKKLVPPIYKERLDDWASHEHEYRKPFSIAVIASPYEPGEHSKEVADFADYQLQLGEEISFQDLSELEDFRRYLRQYAPAKRHPVKRSHSTTSTEDGEGEASPSKRPRLT
jgi:hypothetical protein